MTTVIAKLMYDVGSDSAVALKVGKKLILQAEELHLQEYVSNNDYVRKIKPQLPNVATADATRRYDLEMAEYKLEVEGVRKLREAAEASLSAAAYEQLCVRLGRSSSDCLTAKEIIDGIATHFAKLTSAQAEGINNELQRQWDPNTSLSQHVIFHATKCADLKAGNRGISDQASKEALWRSVIPMKRNAIYTSLTAAMKIPVEDERVTMPQLVAVFLNELLEEQYEDLNADTTKAAGAAEVVLEVREKGERDKRRQAIQKANKEKFADTPLEDKCPVHVGADHLWKDCTHRTGKKLHSSNRK